MTNAEWGTTLPATLRAANRHAPIILMSLVVLWLAIGTNYVGSESATLLLGIFVAAMITTYALLQKFGTASWSDRAIENMADRLAFRRSHSPIVLWCLALLAVATSIVNYTFYSGFTLPQALIQQDALQIALIRQQTSNIPEWLQYLRAFSTKALFPIALVLAIASRAQLLAWTLAIMGAFYVVNMMQKSGPILLFLPTIVFFIITMRYGRAILLAALIGGLVGLMSLITNPSLRPAYVNNAFHTTGESLQAIVPHAWNSTERVSEAPEVEVPEVEVPEVEDGPLAGEASSRIAQGLFTRVAITPGRVVALWVELIPKTIPYGAGCGYRFLAPFLGCEFKAYARVVYDQLYPENVARGLHGSANAGSMMVGYANFGLIGVVFYAALQGVLAWVLFILFRKEVLLIIPINIIYIFFLSSSDLLTTLLSGGWGLAVLFFVLIGRHPGNPDTLPLQVQITEPKRARII